MSVGSLACHAHVRIATAPFATDPYAVRVRYYNQHRSLTTPLVPSGLALQVLANGSVIHHANDLLPAMNDGSEGARVVRAEVDTHTAATVAYGIAFALMALGGGGLGLYSYASGFRANGIVQGVFAGVGIAGVGTATVTFNFTQGLFIARHAQSIEYYAPSLRERLGLCEQSPGAALRDCNARAETPPPQPEAAPTRAE